MANTVLQIRRSNTTAIPASLFVGELAYSGNSTSNSLFIGHPDGSTGVIRIGGGKYGYLHQATPGVNAANTVRITDANAFISNTYTAGLFVSASIASPTANSTAALITTITPQANATQLGSSATGSNTELVTSYAIKTYVDGKTASASAAGSNQQIQFNNSGVFGADATFTFNSANDTLSVGNSVITGTLTTVGSSLVLSTAAAAPVITLASNSTMSNTTISGNNLAVTPVTTFANGIVVTGAVNTGTLNTTGIATLQSANINGLATINANLVVHSVNTFINAQSFSVSTNSTVVPILVASNGTVTNTNINGTNFIVAPATTLNGAVTIANTLNVTGLTTLATANVTGLANVSSLNVAGSGTVGTQISVGANVVMNTTAHGTGNSTVYTNVTSAGITSTGSLAAASMAATANINAANFIASANINAVNMTITGVSTYSGVTTFNNNVNINATGFVVNAGIITLASNSTVNNFSITSNSTVTNTAINGTNFIVNPTTALNGAVTVSNIMSVTGNASLTGAQTTITSTGGVAINTGSFSIVSNSISIQSNSSTYSLLSIANATFSKTTLGTGQDQLVVNSAITYFTNNIAFQTAAAAINLSGSGSITLSNILVNSNGFAVNQASGGFYSGNSTVYTNTTSAGITSTGSIAAASVAATANITAANFTATGNVGAANFSASANVNTVNMIVTGISTHGGVATFNNNAAFYGTGFVVNSATIALASNSTVNAVFITANATVTNTVIGGTNFIVTPATALNGAVTVSNTLNVTGLSTLATANVTGLANVSSLNVAGAGTVGTSIAVGANVIANTTALGVGNSSVYTNVTSAGITSTGSISAANFTATANISAVNMNISGNLTISGTTTTVDTVTLQVKDNFVKVAAQNANLATDVVDFGIYGAANTGGVATYYGLARVAANNGMILFSTTTEPGATTLTAPSLMALSAASITLTTALAATSGGTGTGTYTTGDMLYASGTNALSKRAAGVEGQVLQMLSGVPTWGAIDGGTF